jgi:hypothetical protein
VGSRLIWLRIGTRALVRTVMNFRVPRSQLYKLNRNKTWFGIVSTCFSFSAWGETGSTWYVSHCWPIVPAQDGRWWLWSSQWNEDWHRNRSTRRTPAPVPLCPPQIPHELTWDRTRAAALGSQRLTAWAMARPYRLHLISEHAPLQ